MQNTGCGAAATLQNQNHACCAVIADLVSLVEARSEQLAAGRTDDRKRTSVETSTASPESSTNIIVLDGVSPRYMRAGVALQACHVNVGIALRFLLDRPPRSPCRKPAGAFSHRGITGCCWCRRRGAQQHEPRLFRQDDAIDLSAPPLGPSPPPSASSWRACRAETGCPFPCR
jgi:hypothetical protein